MTKWVKTETYRTVQEAYDFNKKSKEKYGRCRFGRCQT
jgi:hypothetical protein